MKKNKYLIKLDNIDTIYEGEKTPAIYDINLNVQEGEFISIIGPNGAGKTTLLETINGILPHTSGTGHVFGFLGNCRCVNAGEAGVRPRM